MGETAKLAKFNLALLKVDETRDEAHEPEEAEHHTGTVAST